MINNAADLLQRSQPHHLWQYVEETMTRIRFVLNRARSTPAQLGHFEVLTQEDLENLRAMDVQDDDPCWDDSDPAPSHCPPHQPAVYPPARPTSGRERSPTATPRSGSSDPVAAASPWSVMARATNTATHEQG